MSSSPSFPLTNLKVPRGVKGQRSKAASPGLEPGLPVSITLSANFLLESQDCGFLFELVETDDRTARQTEASTKQLLPADCDNHADDAEVGLAGKGPGGEQLRRGYSGSPAHALPRPSYTPYPFPCRP